MPNLITELGADYVNEWFSGAFFQVNDKLHKLRDVYRGEAGMVVRTSSISLNTGAPRWVRDQVGVDVLADFSTFKYPKLGYRQYQQGKTGNIVMSVGSIRAAYRGLRDTTLKYQYLPTSQVLDQVSDGSWDDVNDARKMREIFAPRFTPFTVGVRKLLDGEVAAFAASEDLAVGIACADHSPNPFVIYFRERVVGSVDENGKTHLDNKFLQRSALQRKLFS